MVILLVEENKKIKIELMNMMKKDRIKDCIITHTTTITPQSLTCKRQTPQLLLINISCFYALVSRGTVNLFTRNIPVVVLAQPNEESAALQTLHHGAVDFLVWGQCSARSLRNSLYSAIERFKMKMQTEPQKPYHDALPQEEALCSRIVQSYADGIIVVDNHCIVRFINPAAARLLKKSVSSLLNKRFIHTIVADDRTEIPVAKKSGITQYIEIFAKRIPWQDNGGYLLSLKDITAFKVKEKQLKECAKRYDLAIKGSQDGIWDWNLVTDELYVSRQWLKMCGCTRGSKQLHSAEWFKRIHPDDLPKVKATIDTHLKQNRGMFEIEHRLQHKAGDYRWMQVCGTAIFDKKGKPLRCTGSQRDITERKKAEEGLKNALDDLKIALASEKVLLEELDKKNKDLMELSITDGLTGLFNHRYIQERFDYEFKRTKRYKTPLACMLIDIDNFKKINDTYGHQFGDHVLRQLSVLIKQNTREVDICGRYGGEEFIVITTQSVSGALMHADKLHKAIENYLFTNNDHETGITVSIGIAEYMPDLESKQAMLERADVALYQAKEDGRNLIRVWKEIGQESENIISLDVSSIKRLKSKVSSLTSIMRAAYMKSANTLLHAVNSKDNVTLVHSENVSRYAVKIARAMHISGEEIEIIRNAALLHDIGKIGIDKEILSKKGELTKREHEVLKKHPSIGAHILKDVKFFEKEISIIHHHHERFDGSGYPNGLRGREISLSALILHVADTYDNLLTGRNGKKKLSKHQAIAAIIEGKGRTFSPEVVDAFLTVVQQKKHAASYTAASQ